MSELTQHIQAHDKIGAAEALNTAKLLSGGKLVMLGDSIPNTLNYSLAAAQTNTSDTGAIAWANALLQHVFEIILVRNVGGGSIQDVASRIEHDVYAVNPDWVYVHAGANSAGQLLPTGQPLINDMRYLLNKVMHGGYNIIVMNLLPQGDGAKTLTDDNITGMAAYNSWLSGYCATNGLIYVDGWSALVDDVDTDFGRASSFNDDKHPSAEGGYLMGLAIYNALKSRSDLIPLHQGLFPDDASGNPGVAGQPYEVISLNPENAGDNNSTGTGLSGRRPDSWAIARSSGDDTAVSSIVPADADDPDQTPWLQVVTDGAGTAEAFNQIKISNSATGLSVVGSFFEGAVEVVAPVTSISAGTIIHVTYECKFTGGTNTYTMGLNEGSGWSSAITDADHHMLLKTLPVLVPTGNTGLLTLIYFRTDSGVSATIKVRNARVYKVPNPNLSLCGNVLLPGIKSVNVIHATNDHTLYIDDQRNETLEITDVDTLLSAGIDVIFNDPIMHKYTVVNSTAQTLTFKTTKGTGVAVLAGKRQILSHIGTDIVADSAAV